MLLIISNNSISSLKSIENMDLDDHLVFPHDNNVSFDFLQHDDPPQPPKSLPIITQEYFQTPTKKKKNGCVCKKTSCLKLYCECFAKGKLCTEECSCLNCCNISENKDEIENARYLRKNRLHHGDKRCNCKKSNCRKKYCECYNSGFACGPLCNCIGCLNP